MNRNEWIWVAIRIFGIYLLVLATCEVPDIAGSSMKSYAYWRLHVQAAGIQDKDTKAFQTLMDQSLASSAISFVVSTVKLLFFAAVGLYLIKKGNSLFKLISRQPPPQTSPLAGLPAGTWEKFSEAVRGGDKKLIAELLTQVRYSTTDAENIAGAILADPKRFNF